MSLNKSIEYGKEHRKNIMVLNLFVKVVEMAGVVHIAKATVPTRMIRE